MVNVIAYHIYQISKVTVSIITILSHVKAGTYISERSTTVSIVSFCYVTVDNIV
jgi:hypothetical protein